MADFEQQLRELEQALESTENEFQQQKAPMPTKEGSTEGSKFMTYMYITAGSIPIVIAGGLYFLKPNLVLKKVKGKKKVDMKSLIKWTLIISAFCWACQYGFYYYKVKRS